MRVVGYIRVSTEEQATGQSLDAQRAKLDGYSKLYDLELIDVVVDAGVSAKSLNRPGLQEALSSLRSGDADGLVISKLDRLTRSVGNWQELIDDYFGEKPGKQLLSVADCIDTRTAAGRLVLNVLLSVAQWERETIGERTRDALQYKIAKGERCEKVRFGFDLADDGTMLVPNDLEQAAIGLMRELRAAGVSYPGISAELNARGAHERGEGNLAADDRPEHPDENRIKDMLDRLAEILRGLSPDRQKAFEDYLREQVEKDREVDDRGDPEEGD